MSNNNGVELKSGKGIGPEGSPVDLEFEHTLNCLDCHLTIMGTVKFLYCPHCGYRCKKC